MNADVVVVGAGPAGSMTAMALARQGHDVLLLDRSEFPRDKTCGDAVPAGAFVMLKEHGMGDKIEAAIAAGDLYPARSMLLVSPNGRRMEAEFHKGQNDTESYVAPRLFFDNLLYEHAVESGARFVRAKVKEPVCQDGRTIGVRARVNGSDEIIHAQVVVAADGVTSVVARNLRPPQDEPQDRHRAVAIRAYVEDLEEIPHEIEFYLYREILPGYAWIFPVGPGRANIGLGMRLDQFRARDRSLNEMLQQFMDFPQIKSRLRQGAKLSNVKSWQLNFGSQEIQRVFDGALLVGDAAGLINPLTGGGIHNAIISGQFAAETIDAALRAGDVSRAAMQIYEQRCEEELGENMRRSYLYQRVLLYTPFVVDWIAFVFGANNQIAKTFLTKL